jgi:hypothetical protein
MAASRIADLSVIIASQTAVLDEYIRNNSLSEPAFSADAPTAVFGSAPPDVQKAKSSVIQATIELRQLLEGPVKLLLPEVLLPRHLVLSLLTI